MYCPDQPDSECSRSSNLRDLSQPNAAKGKYRNWRKSASFLQRIKANRTSHGCFGRCVIDRSKGDKVGPLLRRLNDLRDGVGGNTNKGSVAEPLPDFRGGARVAAQMNSVGPDPLRHGPAVVQQEFGIVVGRAATELFGQEFKLGVGKVFLSQLDRTDTAVQGCSYGVFQGPVRRETASVGNQIESEINPTCHRFV